MIMQCDFSFFLFLSLSLSLHVLNPSVLPSLYDTHLLLLSHSQEQPVPILTVCSPHICCMCISVRVPFSRVLSSRLLSVWCVIKGPLNWDELVLSLSSSLCVCVWLSVYFFSAHIWSAHNLYVQARGLQYILAMSITHVQINEQSFKQVVQV